MLVVLSGVCNFLLPVAKLERLVAGKAAGFIALFLPLCASS